MAAPNQWPPRGPPPRSFSGSYMNGGGHEGYGAPPTDGPRNKHTLTLPGFTLYNPYQQDYCFQVPNENNSGGPDGSYYPHLRAGYQLFDTVYEAPAFHNPNQHNPATLSPRTVAAASPYNEPQASMAHQDAQESYAIDHAPSQLASMPQAHGSAAPPASGSGTNGQVRQYSATAGYRGRQNHLPSQQHFRGQDGGGCNRGQQPRNLPSEPSYEMQYGAQQLQPHSQPGLLPTPHAAEVASRSNLNPHARPFYPRSRLRAGGSTDSSCQEPSSPGDARM